MMDSVVVIIFSVFLAISLIGLFIFYTKAEKREKEARDLLEKISKLEEEKSKIQSDVVDVFRNNAEVTDQNKDLLVLLEQYESFIFDISTLLTDDVAFLRGSLARKLSLDIPEVQDLYRGLESFKNKIETIQGMIEEAKKVRGQNS